MSTDLLNQLAAYGEYCDDRQGSVTVEEILWTGAPDLSESTAMFVDTARESGEWATGQPRGDDPTVEHPMQFEESAAGAEQKRWIGVLTAAAAMVLVVVGVVVATDRDGSDAVTDPVPSAATPDLTPSLAPGGAALPQSVIDRVLGYRWSRVPYDEAVFGGGFEQAMSSVTVGGPGLVAVGQAGSAVAQAAVWTSVDGITWLRVPGHEAIFRGAAMSGVTAGGRGLVAVGGADDGAAVWTSVDGLTWSRVPHDEAVFGEAHITSVTAGRLGLVAVGWDGHPHGEESNAVVWTSVDGLTWSRVAHDESIFGEVTGAWMWSVAIGGPGLVAVGEAGRAENSGAAVWTSVDGLTWSRVPHDKAVFGGAMMRSVTAGGPGLVAVGQADDDAVVWTSVDGLTWSRVPPNEAVFGGDAGMGSVTVGVPGLVAVGWDASGAAVWTSVDGITWSWLSNDNAVFGAGPKPVLQMSSVVTGGPGLVAVGPNGVVPTFGATDSDAAVWVAAFEG
jgi:hypothetical protein